MMDVLLYLSYALGQAILIQQGFIRERKSPEVLVFMMVVFAPLVTVAAAIALLVGLLCLVSAPWGRRG